MSLDVYLKYRCEHCNRNEEVYSANITHNLGRMAAEAGIYTELWRPEQKGLTKAKEIIEPLQKGVELMKADPKRFKEFDSPNGWGLYEHFVPFVERYLEACKEFPDATIVISR